MFLNINLLFTHDYTPQNICLYTATPPPSLKFLEIT